MNIVIKKINKHCWNMQLVVPDMVDYTRWSLGVSQHDTLVALINEELLAWEGVMYSRQAWDQWHWYDEPEMNRFLTYIRLKHAEK